MASIILFDDSNFGGRHLRTDQPIANLIDSNFNDITSALIVCEGTWHLYRDISYGEPVWTVEANGGPSGDGLYPSYKDWGGENDAISSLRPA